MKNKLSDLNNHLFCQLERLGDEEVIEKNLADEVNRAKAIALVSEKIISSAKLALDAQKAFTDGKIEDTPEILRVR